MDCEHTRFEFFFERPDLSAGSRLRHALEHEFQCLGDAAPDAALVLSELYANAVLHGQPPVRVRAEAATGRVQLRVEDAANSFGDPRPDSQGLRLVAALARDWGIAVSDAGKTVWADIEARPEPRRA